ncbi:MAG: DUF1674 domain-containing protein [Hyphomicrobiaceae bacterium]
MASDGSQDQPGNAGDGEERRRRAQLSPAAQRALAEADQRRAEAAARDAEQAKELGGRNGPDPVRYGDWEKGGIISDF